MEKITGPMNRDLTAAYLSIVPGLGHLYKHNYVTGLGIMLLGTPLALFVAGLMSFATLGVSLVLLPPMWWGWAAWSAWDADDRSLVPKPGGPS